MKKIFCLLFLFGIVGIAEAQYTTPRTGTGVRYDTRKLNYTYTNKTDAAGADTFALAPNAWNTTIRVALTDSVSVSNPTVTNCYAGDQLRFIISATTGTPFIKFLGSNWVTAGNAAVSTRLRGVIDFVFDGAKWVEASRYVQ